MSDNVEMLQNFRRSDVTISLEVISNGTRKLRPLRYSDRPGRPAVIARVDPPVPEGERNVQLPKLWRGAGRKPMLDGVETPPHCIVLPGVMGLCILAKLRYQSIASFREAHHGSRMLILVAVAKASSESVRVQSSRRSRSWRIGLIEPGVSGAGPMIAHNFAHAPKKRLSV
jgi:hypothetical protein